jgi:hypothetical protein
MTRALTAVTLLTLIAGGCQAPPAPPAETDPAASTVAPEGQAGLPAAAPAAPVRRTHAAAPVGTTNAAAPVGTTNAAAPAAPPPPPEPRTIEVTVPEGTPLSVELLTSLSTKTAEVETPIRGRLRKAIEVDERVVIPAGSDLAGVVTVSERPGRVKGRGQISMRFTSITVGDERLALKAEGITFRGRDERKKDAIKIGGGAGIGAVVGGILGGGDGAAKGAAIGGAAGTGAVLATRGHDAEVASGTTLSTETTAPLTVRVPL